MTRTKIDYVKRIKTIRPYVNFDYNLNDVKKIGLSPQQKREVTRYFKAVNKLTARPFKAYRPKTNNNYEIARKYAHPDTKLKYLNTVFIPTDGKKGYTVSINKKGKLKVKNKFVTQQYIPLDPKKLVKDAKKHVIEEIKQYPDANNFLVRCGAFEIPQSATRKLIASKVDNLTKMYNDKKANNYFGNWLNGLTANTFQNQAELKEYHKQKAKYKREYKRQKRNARRRK